METMQLLKLEPAVQKLKIMFMVMARMIEVHKMSAVQLSKLEQVAWKLQVTLVGMVDRVAVGDMETATLLNL